MYFTFLDYTLRLVDENGYETTREGYGRVEIKREDMIELYGSICDDSFDSREAEVICRSLGFE